MSVRIDNWFLLVAAVGYIRIAGKVLDGPKNRDTLTSAIVGKRDGNVITKSGTIYTLGDMDPDYAKENPDAKEKLLASLEELSELAS